MAYYTFYDNIPEDIMMQIRMKLAKYEWLQNMWQKTLNPLEGLRQRSDLYLGRSSH